MLRLYICQSSLCLCHGLPGNRLRLSPPPLRLHWAPPSSPPAPLQSPGTLAPPRLLVSTTPPRSPGPSLLPDLFSSSAPPVCPGTTNPLVPPGLSTKAPLWLLPPSALTWAFSLLALFGVPPSLLPPLSPPWLLLPSSTSWFLSHPGLSCLPAHPPP